MADARLHRTVAALRRAGCDVWVRGLGDRALGPKGARVMTAPSKGKLRRGLRALAWPLRGRCDVLVTIDPDTSLTAWLRPGRWVADVHEDYRELLRDRSWVPGPLLRVLRLAVSGLNAMISRADLVLVADEHVPPMAPHRYVMRNEPDVTVLPPMPAPSPRVAGEERAGVSPSPRVAGEERAGVSPSPRVAGGERAGVSPSPRVAGEERASVSRGEAPFTAVYIGDNRTSRGLKAMIEAVAGTADDATPWRLDLVGPVAAGDREWFDERMTRPDARHVTFHDRMPPAEAWRIAERADVGLCLLADTPAFREAMPSKVYEYLAMGLPTVATPLPRVKALLDEAEAGMIVDDETAATDALRRFATDEAERSRLVANARSAGQDLRDKPSTYDEAARRIAALAP